MNRKSFLRHCLMVCAISILPKSLLPSFGELELDDVPEKLEQRFDGIIPTLLREANTVTYKPGEFTRAVMIGFYGKHKK